MGVKHFQLHIFQNHNNLYYKKYEYLKWTYCVYASSSTCLLLDSARVALCNWQFKIIFIYPVLSPGVAPQFIRYKRPHIHSSPFKPHFILLAAPHKQKVSSRRVGWIVVFTCDDVKDSLTLWLSEMERLELKWVRPVQLPFYQCQNV